MGGDVSNAGSVAILGTAVSTGTYSQSAGSTKVNGTLTTPTLNLYGGILLGTGTITGDVNNIGGTVTPGDAPGTLSINGNYTQDSGGTLDITVVSDTLFSTLAVSGAASVGGVLNLDPQGSYNLVDGTSFQVITFASETGDFATKNLGYYFVPVYDGNDLTLCFEPTVGQMVFLVTNTDDSGAGSLRQAILDANAYTGPNDVIQFDITGSGVQSIVLQSALPTITDPVEIDGWSQPGWTTTPLIELNGTDAGGGACGLFIDTSNCAVLGLVIDSFGGSGIVIAGGSSNWIAGNYIGTNTSGTASSENGNFGVLINGGAKDNIIGGAAAGDGNVISGNGLDGIRITDPGTDNNVVDGNYIGTDATGTVAIGNGWCGVQIVLGAQYNQIGCTGIGESTAERNIISGNDLAGVYLLGAGTNYNTLAGNYIGTDATGEVAVANGWAGFEIHNGAQHNTAEGNLISGNDCAGVWITDQGTNNNVVEDNYIGTNAAGNAAIRNGWSGVTILAGAQNNITEGNIISGNGWDGVDIYDSGTSGNIVAGNYIGTDISGTMALGNGAAGVEIWSGATGNLVGVNGNDSDPQAERNLISGNQWGGVEIHDYGTSGNIVAGNKIGTDISGTIAVGNSGAGVEIWNGATNNRVGVNGNDSDPRAEANLISGNDWNGVVIHDQGTTGNIVAGNLIGTDIHGTAALPNQYSGVAIYNGAVNNWVGAGGNGTAFTSERNIISGNTNNGIWIWNTGTDNNVVAGNYIGTDDTGTVALGHWNQGVAIGGGAEGNQIGSNGAEVNTAERNIISGNGNSGVWIEDTGTNNNIVAGNYIGTDVTGTVAVANDWSGVEIHNGAQSNIAEGNLISGNDGAGVWITDQGTNNNTVAGNYIGTNAAGNAPIGNGLSGVEIHGGAQDNQIGANDNGVADTAERKIISGNGHAGIWITDSETNNNVVDGNYIGTNAAGNAAVGNGWSGVTILAGAQNNITDGNLISGNGNAGVWITDPGTNNNIVTGNDVGTDATGTVAIGNGWSGVGVVAGAQNNIIGTVGAGNVIAFNGFNGNGNGEAGVTIGNNPADVNTVGNSIQGNSIFGNAVLGIDLGNDGVSENTPGGPHSGPNNLQNFPVLTSAVTASGATTILGTLNSTPDTTFCIEFFSNKVGDPSGYGQGQTYLGFTNATTDVSGNASFTFTSPTVPAGQCIFTATATDPSGNTSEFSASCKTTPVLSWANPAAITYGTPLCSQLDAKASVAGTFAYSPAAGTVLSAGSGQTLSVTFTPTDTTDYTTATYTTTINVNQAPLTVTAANETMAHGGAVPALAYTYTGLVNGDKSASFTGGLTTSATSSSGVGGYAIGEGSLAATGNYTIGTFVAGTLNVANPAAVVSSSPSKPAPINTTSTSFIVVFNGSVQNVTPAAFQVTTTGTATGTVTGVSATSGTSFTVTVGSITGDGTLRLDLKSGNGIQDANGLQPAAFTSGTTLTVDHTPPVSKAGPLSLAQASDTFTVPVTFSDPAGASGAVPSGVASVDLYVSANYGPFVLYQTLSAGGAASGTLNFTFTGADRNTYTFHSIAHDVAGNTESKSAIVIETSTYVPDLNPPVSHVMAASPTYSWGPFPASIFNGLPTSSYSTGVFTLEWAGADPDQPAGGSIATVSVYVQVDSGAAKLVGTITPGSPTAVSSGGSTYYVYSGSMSYNALGDSLSHTYSFYSVGTDDEQKEQYAPQAGPASPDVTFSNITYGAPLAIQNFAVEDGIAERSFIQYLDVDFNQSLSSNPSSTVLQGLANGLASNPNSYVQLIWYGENLTSSSAPAGSVNLFNTGTTASVSLTGNDLHINFGANGITSLLTGTGVNGTGSPTKTIGDGWYALGIDPTGNPSNGQVFWLTFFRLLGDTNGDGVVTGPYTTKNTDAYTVYNAIGESGPLLNADVDGSGAVNTKDLSYTVSAKGDAVGATAPKNFPQFELFAGVAGTGLNKAVAVTQM